ncbi:hypothetical protein AnigIFM60653_007734 [Aspergillus niger]|nr:hypothetical protein AnigIFM50267_011620 [Aspergillus niger]GLA06788.1 hypothetical protein AnigIFM60653_007734 [Aspergillus niger]
MSDDGTKAKSHKDLIKCLEKKQAIMEHLGDIKEKVTNLPWCYLSEDFQKHINIKLTFHNLEDHQSTHGKVYFQPYPGHGFPSIPWDEIRLYDFEPGLRAETYRIQKNLDNILASFPPPWEIWLERKFFKENEQVGECFRALYHWYAVKEAETHERTDTPHCTVRILQFTEPEELLMRSEVLCALRYMMHKFTYKRYEDQTIFPVLITSIFPSKVRILQVYFDGKYLHFAKSQLYDLKENDHEKYTLLARWMFPVPCGDVETVNIRGRKLSNAVMEQVEDWKQKQEAMNINASTAK